jgi:alpha-1,2-mannosyltransferase
MQTAPRTNTIGTALRRHWFLLTVLLIFAGVSIQYTSKALKDRSAIVRFMEQLRNMDSGEDIYHRYSYPHPPLMAWMLRQLARLPDLAGALVWFYLKVALTLLSLRWVFQMVEEPGRPFPEWAKALTLLLSLRPIIGDLSHGNVNLFILFLVVAALFAYSRGRDVVAGLVLALAIVCRLTPALFLPYFLYKRSWKTLAGCALGLVLFVFVLPAGLLGQEENNKMLHSWIDMWIKPYLVAGTITSEHNNQSLPGLLFRLTTHSPSFSTYIDDRYTPTEYHNVIDVDPAVVRWGLKGCLVAFAGLMAWACRTPAQPRRNWRLAAEFSLIALGTLLFNERTWKHHCVTLVLPFAVLAYYLAACRPPARLRWAVIGMIAAVVLLISATSTGLLDDRFAKLAQVYGAYVWACLVCVAAMTVMLRSRSDAAGGLAGLPMPLAA